MRRYTHMGDIEDIEAVLQATNHTSDRFVSRPQILLVCVDGHFLEFLLYFEQLHELGHAKEAQEFEGRHRSMVRTAFRGELEYNRDPRNWNGRDGIWDQPV
jgi:hypothetical protein